MASFDSLPYETLLDIFELAIDKTNFFEIGSIPSRGIENTNHRIMRSASLVSKSWQIPAQTVLWQQVALRGGAQALSFLKSSKKFRVHSLYFDGVDYGDITPELTAQVLNSLTGLRSLHLGFGMHGINFRDICLPSLSELKWLVLSCDILGTAEENFPLSPPFNLTKLEIKALSIDNTFVTSLVTPSLTTLKLLVPHSRILTSPFFRHPHYYLLKESAPYLTNLALSFSGDQGPIDIAAYLPLLKLCTSVKTFKTFGDLNLVSFLNSFQPNQIQNLHFPMKHGSPSHHIIIGIGLPGMRRLESLRLLKFWGSWENVGLVAAHQIKNECDSLKIRVIFDE